MSKENSGNKSKTKRKLTKIFLACSLIMIGVIILVVVFSSGGSSDFANRMYAKCLDGKVGSINVNNIFSDSQKAVSDCDKVRTNARRYQHKYEQCLADEKDKIGSTMKEYVDYLWGGYTTEGDGTGYYLKRPYEEYAAKYETEGDAISAAYLARDTKCYNKVLAN